MKGVKHTVLLTPLISAVYVSVQSTEKANLNSAHDIYRKWKRMCYKNDSNNEKKNEIWRNNIIIKKRKKKKSLKKNIMTTKIY